MCVGQSCESLENMYQKRKRSKFLSASFVLLCSNNIFPRECAHALVVAQNRCCLHISHRCKWCGTRDKWSIEFDFNLIETKRIYPIAPSMRERVLIKLIKSKFTDFAMSLLVETAFHASCSAAAAVYMVRRPSFLHTVAMMQVECKSHLSIRVPAEKICRTAKCTCAIDWRNWLWSISGTTIKLAVIEENPLSKLIELSHSADADYSTQHYCIYFNYKISFQLWSKSSNRSKMRGSETCTIIRRQPKCFAQFLQFQ